MKKIAATFALALLISGGIATQADAARLKSGKSTSTSSARL